MLGVLGFVIMGIIVYLLLKNVTVPSIAFIAVPLVVVFVVIPVLNLVFGTHLDGFTLREVGGYVKEGVLGTAELAALFIFSITFFGLMNDAGMFDRIINALARRAGDNVTMVCLLTCLIAMIGHLDGSGASTFLITIPAMRPVFNRLRMRETSLMLIATAAMGVMNLLPWGGPTMRAASVVNVDANILWRAIMPMQGVGLVLAFAVAYFVAKIEIRRGAGFNSNLPEDPEMAAEAAELAAKKNELARPRLFWFNVGLTLAVILALTFVKLPSYFIFMIGAAVALLANYPGAELQESRIRAHSKGAIMMASTLLAAGVLLGILENSKIMDDMGTVMVGILPAAFGPYVALIIGVLSAPLAIFFCTDSYYFGVMPVVVAVATKYGVSPMDVAVTMVVCRNLACFISPVVPATFLGCGLAGVNIRDHIKNAFFWVWGMSLVMLASGILFGIVRLGAQAATA